MGVVAGLASDDTVCSILENDTFTTLGSSVSASVGVAEALVLAAPAYNLVSDNVPRLPPEFTTVNVTEGVDTYDQNILALICAICVSVISLRSAPS